MRLASFPRRRYTTTTTPIEPLPSLSRAIGGPKIYIKRDDLLGLAAGGNKTRKLEFLVADALASGADTLITCGAVQSNHCRLTVAAAAREGLACHLVIEERVTNSYARNATGNNFLFHLLGVASITVVDDLERTIPEMHRLADRAAAAGHRAYVIPGGGSNAIGALGYVDCFDELTAQALESGIAFRSIVCASGSGGTHSGLLAGAVDQSGPEVVGISVRHPAAIQADRIRALTTDILHLGGSTAVVPTDAVIVEDGYIGAGYSLPTDSMVEAVRLVAQTEGILLDPVYTGKAMAGLIDQVRRGRWSRDDAVLFLHTGGHPALFAYQSVLDADPSGDHPL